MDEQTNIPNSKRIQNFFAEISKLDVHLELPCLNSICELVTRSFQWQICEIFKWVTVGENAGICRFAGRIKLFHVIKSSQEDDIEATIVSKNPFLLPTLIPGPNYYPLEDKDAWTINCLLWGKCPNCGEIAKTRGRDRICKGKSCSDNKKLIVPGVVLFTNDIMNEKVKSDFQLKEYLEGYGDKLLKGRLSTFLALPIFSNEDSLIGVLRLMNKYKVNNKGDYEIDYIEQYEPQVFGVVTEFIQKVISNHLHLRQRGDLLTECVHAISKDLPVKVNLDKICLVLSNSFSAKVNTIDSNDSKAKKASKYISNLNNEEKQLSLKICQLTEKEIIVPLVSRENKSSIYISLERNTKGFTWEEIEILDYLGNNLPEYLKLYLEMDALRRNVKSRDRLDNILGKSEKIQKIYDLITHVARSYDTLALITGESGTGKELIARAIHNESDRNKKPFVPVHCAAFNESVLESEIFGHEKGAFTGALSTKRGRFELADGGTIFLDEIGEIPPSIQVKLLRVLQEFEFERVGGEKTISVDVRVIVATNKEDLKIEVKEGRFRKDLYYRIKGFPIEVPPLRERKEDIPLLAKHFLQKFNEKNKKKVKNISEEALDVLKSYSWEGNVRELENSIKSAMVSASTTINLEDLPAEIKRESSLKIGESLEDKELSNILQCVAECDGNMTEAAKRLNVDRKTIQNKIKPILENCWNNSGGDLTMVASMIGHGWDTSLCKKKLKDFNIIKRESRQ